MTTKSNPKNKSQVRNTRGNEGKVAGDATGDQNAFTVCPFDQRTRQHAGSQSTNRECSDIKTVLVRFH